MELQKAKQNFLAAFNPAEQRQYEDSLKYYRDLKNVTDTAREEGREEGRMQGKEEQLRETLRTLRANGFAVEAISSGLGLPVEAVRRLLKDGE